VQNLKGPKFGQGVGREAVHTPRSLATADRAAVVVLLALFLRRLAVMITCGVRLVMRVVVVLSSGVLPIEPALGRSAVPEKLVTFAVFFKKEWRMREIN
jgi:hypothetical protein